MFNLLRRAKQRKSYKNKNYVDDGDDDEGANVRAIVRNYTARTAAANEREQQQQQQQQQKQQQAKVRQSARYRQFSGGESEQEHDREAKRLPYRRAVVIDELEDFGDLEATSATATALNAATTTNDNPIYFEQQRQQQQNQQRRVSNDNNNDNEEEYEKVKLAKTAANLNARHASKADNADTADTADSDVDDLEGWVICDDIITRTANTKTNSANSNESNECVAIGNNINKIYEYKAATKTKPKSSATTTTSGAAAGEADRGVHANSCSSSGRSQNEEPEWQCRHANVPFGTNKTLIGEAINDCKDDNGDNDDDNENVYSDEQHHIISSKAIEQFNSGSQDRTLRFDKSANRWQTENAEKFDALAAAAAARATRTATATATTGSDRRNESTRAPATVINEVKYRNSSDTSNTQSKSKSKERETKRHSRLSLTNFGLSLTSASGSGSSSGSSSEHKKTKEKATDSQKVTATNLCELTKAKKSTSFFGSRTTKNKNNNNNNSNSNNCIQQQGSKQNDSNVKESAKKLKPLQKSREFLSDIFMARGRNHNRHRNNHNPTNSSNINSYHQQQQQQPQQHQQQKEQQQQQQQQQQSIKTVTANTAQVGIKNDNSIIMDNNRQQQAEQHRHNDQHHHHHQHAVHLETNSDPAYMSTNSYQMTASNNSNKKNFALSDRQQEQQQEQQQQQQQKQQQQKQKEQQQQQQKRERAKEQKLSAFEEQAKRASNSANSHSDVSGDSSSVGAAGFYQTELNGMSGAERDIIQAVNVEQLGVEQRRSVVHGGNEPTDKRQEAHGVLHSELPTSTPGVCDELTSCEREILSQRNSNSNSTNNNNNNKNNNNSSNYNKNNDHNINNDNDNGIRDRILLSSGETGDAARDITHTIMGQMSGKPEQQGTAPNSRASTPRDFRESILTDARVDSSSLPSPSLSSSSSPKRNTGGGVSVGVGVGMVPKITVADYSDDSSEHSPTEQEIFYDFESEQRQGSDNKEMADDGYDCISVEPVDDADDGEIFAAAAALAANIPTTVYQTPRWTRLSHVKLENVPEQVEDEEAASEGKEEDEEEEDDNDREEEEEDEEEDDGFVNLEHELYKKKMQNANDKREATSTERIARSPLKSTNTSDSNLSTSYPDSGIGLESSSQEQQQQQQQQQPLQHSSSKYCLDNESDLAARATSTLLHARSSSFVRDGNSTDCEETLLLDDEQLPPNPRERLVCIESISLPDVVVESTTATNAATANSATMQGASATASSESSHDEQININVSSGAAGNNVGNVHFIPIHVEGGSMIGRKSGSCSRSRSRSGSPMQQQQRSFDDNCIGGSKRLNAQLNGHLHDTMPPTIEIIEDGSVLSDYGSSNTTAKTSDYQAELLKQELNDEKIHHAKQIEDAQKNVHHLQNKVGDMQRNIEKLEQELSLKTWNVERLQSELQAAHKDDEFVRKKLKLLENEKTILRHKFNESEDQFRSKYAELEAQYNELSEKYKQTQCLASNLQTQLAAAQNEAEEWRDEVNRIRVELEEQIRILKNALDNSEAERKICEDKWQKEFEMLRTHNIEREETLMVDCEWQLRQMQKQSKDKVDKATNDCKQALIRKEELEEELSQRKHEVENLRVYQAQVNSLRGVVTEQEHSIQTLMDQIETLREELELANENLETQIEAVHKIKYQCDNAICDKERQMIYRIDEVRNEAAAFWENKLYTEMTRLKAELESVYVDERREELDKLQVEHVEELRVLTTRYTANEDELRTELEELQERLNRKSGEFFDLREKSDSALLQTRMHLDRADREYQNAMCREEERRQVLEEKLRKEFDEEKEEMEEKFRERLGQVKDEFSKELQLSTQDMLEQHKKTLEQQKATLLAEKDEALQHLADRHRKKLAVAEERIKEIELRHQRDLKDLKAAYDAEKAALDKRDISNANEIEMLHRKCRCLTNLFEEMRMRYERREPRHEDLREITELRSRCESQEHDLYVLTDRLREMQIQMSELQQSGESTNRKNGKQVKKPPPKTIPTNCDVIYEENEERESPPPRTTTNGANKVSETENGKEDENENANEDEDEEEEDGDAASEEDTDADEQSDTESNHEVSNKKNVNTVNEDDMHMITAV